ncbi:MAG: carboxypeptidase-like regulatory domain-containing protein [Armatimonadota bacterium]
MRYTLLVVMVLGLWLACIAQQVMTPLTPGRGNGPVTLLKPDGTPAAGAKVLARTFAGWTFTPGSKPRMTREVVYTADAQGQVTIGFPVEQATYQPFTSYALIAAPGCAVTVMALSEFAGTITLTPEKMLDVLCTKADGTAAAGAAISFVRIGELYHFTNPLCGVATPALTFRCGANGVARVPILYLGKGNEIINRNVEAYVTLGGLVSGCAYPVLLPTAAKPEPFAVKLKPAVTLTGSVTTPNGKPLAGAVVSHATLPVPPVTTNAAGGYTLAGIPMAAHNIERLLITHPDYAQAQVIAEFPGPATPAVVLQPLVKISGRVVDAVGNPIAKTFDIRVSFNTSAARGNAGLDADRYTTAADGSFTLRIPPQSALIALGAGFKGTMLERTFADGETVNLLVEPGQGGGRR